MNIHSTLLLRAFCLVVELLLYLLIWILPFIASTAVVVFTKHTNNRCRRLFEIDVYEALTLRICDSDNIN